MEKKKEGFVFSTELFVRVWTIELSSAWHEIKSRQSCIQYPQCIAGGRGHHQVPAHRVPHVIALSFVSTKPVHLLTLGAAVPRQHTAAAFLEMLPLHGLSSAMRALVVIVPAYAEGRDAHLRPPVVQSVVKKASRCDLLHARADVGYRVHEVDELLGYRLF